MEELLNILKGIRDDIDFENEDSLVDGGLLDSFDVVGLVTELRDAYDVEFDVTDLTPENFNSAKAIYELIERKMNEV
ncbi:MAG: acyl carrier protein [Lachnospiraceae bacterium]|nr:acyl carrier protein [Lachnospiraceae bacterium]